MKDRPRALCAAIACLVAASASPAGAELGTELVAAGLDEPLFATAPAGDARLFVVERAGRVRIVRNGAVTGTFLDVSGKVGIAGEGGLLGLAFPPDHAATGFVFVYYVDDKNHSVLARHSLGANPDVADGPRRDVLKIDQPSTTNHKGGTIAFGPDGFLYLGLGDGGGSYDPDERAQDGADLLGKMLRLDVGVPRAPGSLPGTTDHYGIPADNPFVGPDGIRDEVWALGLRNPYRWSFDRETGDLWIADVGQSAREEVNFEPAGDPGGRNWGWDVMEGSLCSASDPAPSPPCNHPALSLPVHEYGHGGGNCSITGGGVYRGLRAPTARGLYFFADWCTGTVWTLDPATGAVQDRTAELAPVAGTPRQIVGFGEDGAGELHIVLSGGEIHRIVERTACGNGADDDGDGAIDFPADPGCADAASLREDPACNDGRDNDLDGAVDLLDPDCQGDPSRTRERAGGGCGGSSRGAEAALALPGALWLGRRRRR